MNNRCPVCCKYTCECYEEQEPKKFALSLISIPKETIKEPELVEVTCPRCHGRGGIPDPVWCGDWPCLTCNSTGSILVSKR